jgi:bile acid-coenzyme A ligase
MGVQPDDFVTIGLPNSIAFFEAAFAVWKLGATPQPVSARLPEGERDAIIEITNPSLMVGFEANEAGSTPTVPVGFEPDANLLDSALPERTARYLKAMTSGGSTGRPKLIVSEQPAVFDPDDPFFNFPRDSAVLVPGPLYHNGPFLFAIGGLFKGNHVAVTTRFDLLDTLRMIAAIQADTVYMVTDRHFKAHFSARPPVSSAGISAVSYLGSDQIRTHLLRASRSVVRVAMGAERRTDRTHPRPCPEPNTLSNRVG